MRRTGQRPVTMKGVSRRTTTNIEMVMLKIASKKKENKAEEESASEATRVDWQRTAAMTVWPGSQLRRQDLPA